MANRSVGIKEAALVDMVHWRFSRAKLQAVNQRLVQAINAMPLSSVFKVEDNRLYSGSDGKIINGATAQGIGRAETTDFNVSPGHGVSGQVDRHRVMLGDGNATKARGQVA